MTHDTCDVTPLLLSKFKREHKTPNKIKENKRKKIKPKGKYNRVLSIIHNSDIHSISIDICLFSYNY